MIIIDARRLVLERTTLEALRQPGLTRSLIYSGDTIIRLLKVRKHMAELKF